MMYKVMYHDGVFQLVMELIKPHDKELALVCLVGPAYLC